MKLLNRAQVQYIEPACLSVLHIQVILLETDFMENPGTERNGGSATEVSYSFKTIEREFCSIFNPIIFFVSATTLAQSLIVCCPEPSLKLLESNVESLNNYEMTF